MNNMVVSPHWESAVMSQTQDLDSLESTETILPSCVFNKLTKYLDYLESPETILPSCVFQQTEQRFRLSGKYRNYLPSCVFNKLTKDLDYLKSTETILPSCVFNKLTTEYFTITTTYKKGPFHIPFHMPWEVLLKILLYFQTLLQFFVFSNLCALNGLLPTIGADFQTDWNRWSSNNRTQTTICGKSTKEMVVDFPTPNDTKTNRGIAFVMSTWAGSGAFFIFEWKVLGQNAVWWIKYWTFVSFNFLNTCPTNRAKSG